MKLLEIQVRQMIFDFRPVFTFLSTARLASSSWYFCVDQFFWAIEFRAVDHLPMCWVYFLSFFYSLQISVVSHLSYFENDYDQFWDSIIWKIVWWYSIGCSRQAITESLKITATGCRERTRNHVQSNIFWVKNIT